MEVNKKEEGITLIELMVAIAIIGVVIAALYMSYFTAVRVFAFNQEKVEFHRNQRLISESIGKYIRSANKIDIIDSNILLIEYKKNGTTNKIKFFNKNDYFYIDSDPDDNTKGEKQTSQLKLDDLKFVNDAGVINIEITLLNDNNDSYTFSEQFHPRIKNVSIVLTP